jgi:hypothetical protein
MTPGSRIGTLHSEREPAELAVELLEGSGPAADANRVCFVS